MHTLVPPRLQKKIYRPDKSTTTQKENLPSPKRKTQTKNNQSKKRHPFFNKSILAIANELNLPPMSLLKRISERIKTRTGKNNINSVMHKLSGEEISHCLDILRI